MSQANSKIVCKHCGFTLTGDHRGPCPSCGKVGKIISVIGSGGAVFGGSVSVQTIRTIYQKNRAAFAILILITIVSPFVGLFIVGIPGIFVGLILSAISYFLGPKAVTKIIEKKYFN